jgi:hypothetical protein
LAAAAADTDDDCNNDVDDADYDISGYDETDAAAFPIVDASILFLNESCCCVCCVINGSELEHKQKNLKKAAPSTKCQK